MNTRLGSLASFAASSNSRPGEPDGDITDPHLARAVVDDERPGLDDVGLPEHRPAQERLHARQKLEVDVARDDVVRSALEGADADDRVRARLGEDDQRDVAVPRPPGLAGADPPAEVGLTRDDDVGQEPLGEVERPCGPCRPRTP